VGFNLPARILPFYVFAEALFGGLAVHYKWQIGAARPQIVRGACHDWHR
jgi:hypothetical protein